MRKILTKEQKDKKNRFNQIVIGVLLIGLMLFGTLGYAFSGREEDNSEKIDYNGIEFIQDDSGYWIFIVQNYEFITQYNPEEIKEIVFSGFSSINDYSEKPLYFVSDYNEPNFEISKNLDRFVSRMQNACLDENCEYDFPIKDCSVDNIIVVNEPEDDNEKIYQQEKCIFIIADIENQTKYADAFIFKILGV